MKQMFFLFCLFSLSMNAQEKFILYFDSAQAEATVTSLKELQNWITANPNIAVETINGFTDKTGKTAFNQDLSEKRAAYVYALLKTTNVNLDYAVKNAFGEQKATAYNNAPDRKVEISFVKAEYSKPQPPTDTELAEQFVNAKVGDVIILKNVLFYGGTTFVLAESKPVLKELLNIMLSHPKLKIDIQGHICCEVDDITDLSGRRAQEIGLYLVNNGVNKKRITTRGFGGHRPINPVPERSDEERYVNRRVEIEIVSN